MHILSTLHQCKLMQTYNIKNIGPKTDPCRTPQELHYSGIVTLTFPDSSVAASTSLFFTVTSFLFTVIHQVQML